MRRRGGFTLVELMVVLAVTGFVVAGLGKLLTHRRAELHLEHRRGLQPLVAEAVLRALRADLRSAAAARVADGALLIDHADKRQTSYRLRDGWLERRVTPARPSARPERLGRFASFEPRVEGKLLQLRLRQRRVAGPLSAWHRLQTQLAIGGPLSPISVKRGVR
jgi:prepilin-type N-terminal cleavage/methylation domain-containing protein